MNEDRLEMFRQRYQEQNIPWDTGITPPEIVAVVVEMPPGRALDLGCGTGTNIRYLLQRGWQADGMDFVPQAVAAARAKLAVYTPESCRIHCHDVTRLDECPGLRAPYNLTIDIGCGHGLAAAEQRAKYAQDIATLLAPGGTFMLYAHQPAAGKAMGWTPGDVQFAFSPYFDILWQALSMDTTSGYPSGWYCLVK